MRASPRRAAPWLPLAVGLVAMSAAAAHGQDAGVAQPAGLLGVHWHWVQFTTPGAAPLIPAHTDRYWVEFAAEGKLAFQADCNRGTGVWTQRGRELKLQPLASTLAACPEGSLDSRFTQLLASVRGASVLGRTLLLRLPDGGIIHFEAVPTDAQQ